MLASEFSPRSGTLRGLLGMRMVGKQNSHLAGEGNGCLNGPQVGIDDDDDSSYCLESISTCQALS